MSKENHIERRLIDGLTGLKHTYLPDNIDRKSLEYNFRQKFEALGAEVDIVL